MVIKNIFIQWILLYFFNFFLPLEEVNKEMNNNIKKVYSSLEESINNLIK